MLHILSNVLVMSKQPIAEEGGDFWKKIRYSATATAAIGAGLFAITSVIKKQGFVSNLVDEMQAAMHARVSVRVVHQCPAGHDDGT